MDFIYDPSLVLYLPLYELDGASFMSKDVYGHLATVTGALWTPRGRDFDGIDDYVDCGTLPSLSQLNYPFTVLAWINPTILGVNKPIFSRVDYNGWWFEVYNTWLRVQSVGTFVDSAGFTLQSNVWQHVAVVLNGLTATFYYQGAQYNSPTFAPTLQQVGGISYVGGITYFFDGLIGEVIIYNRALTALEIQKDYLATKWRYQ